MSEYGLVFSDTALSAANDSGITDAFPLTSNNTSGQICSDGGGLINYQFQVTDLPYNLVQSGQTIFGATVRDDSYSSPMWVTLDQGQVAAGGNVSQMIIYPGPAFRFARLLLSYDSSNAANTSASVQVFTYVGG